MKTLLAIIIIASTSCGIVRNPDGSYSATLSPEGAQFLKNKIEGGK